MGPKQTLEERRTVAVTWLIGALYSRPAVYVRAKMIRSNREQIRKYQRGANVSAILVRVEWYVSNRSML